MTNQQYSLWIIPPEEQRVRLQRVITALSEQYSTPSLEPHVTLYGRIIGEEADVLVKTEQLANSVSPLTISLTDFGQRDEFYRSVFICVKKSKKLEEAYQAAHGVFESLLHSKYQGREFIPHLSIMYGAVSAEVKEGIIASLDKAVLQPFTADVISLHRLVQEPAEWTKVRDFHLKD